MSEDKEIQGGEEAVNNNNVEVGGELEKDEEENQKK